MSQQSTINNQQIAIKVDNVSKTFKLPHEKTSSIKSALVNFRKRRTYEKQEVLKDISFEIKKGEFFGIVGRNGSGKSTLLKILAGIYTPTDGSIKVNGSLTPFIELGVGFNPELTGRENVFLNGALLGFSRKEMNEMYQEIVGFAELERFMDQKLKNYSSGMQVRLAFSIAIRAKSDVLLIDEVLAVGDAAFQKKCFKTFRKLKESKQTIILVTHDMSNVERFCDKVLIVDKGHKPEVLDVAEAVATYNRLNYSSGDSPESASEPHKTEIRITKVECVDKQGEKQKVFNHNDLLTVRISVDSDQTKKNEKIVIGLAFYDADGVNIAGPNSYKKNFVVQDNVIEYKIKNVPFAVGEYRLVAGLFDEYVKQTFDFIDNAASFFVNSDETIHGKITLNDEWHAKKPGRTT